MQSDLSRIESQQIKNATLLLVPGKRIERDWTVAEEIIVSIVNWEKYQADHGRNTYIWFRFHHNFFRHGRYLDLGPEDSIFWIYLLCECADRRSKTLKLNTKITCAQLGISQSQLQSRLQSMISKGYIEGRSHNAYEASHTAVPDRENRENRENIRETASLSTSSTRELPLLARIWNQHRGKLPEVKGCSRERVRKAEALFAQNPDPDYWARVVARISASKFCNGSGERGWRATFDFLIRPDTHNKVVEGQYDSRPSQTTNVKTAAEILND